MREVSHRIVRRLQVELERWRTRSGWRPLPRSLVGPGNEAFAGVEDWEAIWKRNYVIDEDAVSKVEQGKIRFFGYGELDIGRPVEWHRDPLTGKRMSLRHRSRLDYRRGDVGNVKVVWELGRHQHLVPVAVAYAVTGRQRYRDIVTTQIASWIATNPYGMGIHWTSALEVALRLIAWAFVHGLFALRDGPSGLFARTADASGFGNSIFQHAYFIRHNLSRYSSANNHLIGELCGLLIGSLIFNIGEEGNRWSAFALTELGREASAQVYGDGVDKEQSTYYHLWVLEYLLVSDLVGSRCGASFDESYRCRIRKMASFLRDLSPRGGVPPQIGDADDGTVMRFDTVATNPYGDVLRAVEIAFEKGRRIPDFSGTHQKAFWYWMIGSVGESGGASGCQASSRPYPRVYPDGGYAILFAGESHLVFDAGPLGYLSIAAHGHADALSFCLALGDGWWLVDPGTYSYHDQPTWRDYFRSTAAHNTLVVDGENQSLVAGAFLWRRHAGARLQSHGLDTKGWQVVSGTHDGYSALGVRHTREVRVAPNGEEIHISDRIEGTGWHELALHFHMAPGISVVESTEGWKARRASERAGLQVAVDPEWGWEAIAAQVGPILGWYSPRLGEKQATTTLRGLRRTWLPCHVVTRFRVAAHP